MSNRENFIRQKLMLGENGQNLLQNATVGIVGLGGLGSNCSTHLASAGIGSFILVDYQVSEPSNLNRQFIHAGDSLHLNKVESACRWIHKINPEANVVSLNTKVENSDAKEVLRDCDIIMDCLDSYASRMSLNDLALYCNKTMVHAAVQEAHGQVTVIVPGRTPCLSCIMPFSEDLESKNIIGAAAGAVGSIQAMEAIKIISGLGSVLENKILTLDLMSNTFLISPVFRSEFCSSCKNIK